MNEPSVSLALPSAIDGRRALAFRRANRHSRQVRWLRRAIIGAVVLFVGSVTLIVVLDPFGKKIEGASIQGATIDGTKVTMISPKLSGYQKDGRPYAIEAARAVQDVKAPTMFELHDLKASVVMLDHSTTRLTAPMGAYNSAVETMTLTGGAHVVGDNGLDAVTDDAVVEFKTNSLHADKPVAVTMPGKRITADSMRIVEGGKQVTFDGHVHRELVPAERTVAADESAEAGTP